MDRNLHKIAYIFLTARSLLGSVRRHSDPVSSRCSHHQQSVSTRQGKLWLKLNITSFILIKLCFFGLLLFWTTSSLCANYSTLDATNLLQQQFPHLKLNRFDQPLPVWKLYNKNKLFGYAFESQAIAKIPAYSGKPINLLVVISPQGIIQWIKLIEHHEPILLVGITEQVLLDFIDQYKGLSIHQPIKIGSNTTNNH